MSKIKQHAAQFGYTAEDRPRDVTVWRNNCYAIALSLPAGRGWPTDYEHLRAGGIWRGGARECHGWLASTPDAEVAICGVLMDRALFEFGVLLASDDMSSLTIYAARGQLTYPVATAIVLTGPTTQVCAMGLIPDPSAQVPAFPAAMQESRCPG